AALPRGAPVLLVTPGVAPLPGEFFVFYRALYDLAPRPVWWANPAAPNGTYQSRWWIQAPLTAEALTAIARSKGARTVLFYEAAVPVGPPPAVELTPEARVVPLDGQPLDLAEREGPAHALMPWSPAGLAAGLLAILALGGALVVGARR